METNELGRGLIHPETWVPDEEVHMTESLKIDPPTSSILVKLCIDVRERYRKGLWEKLNAIVEDSSYFTVKRTETGYVIDVDGAVGDLYLGEDPFLVDYEAALAKLDKDTPIGLRHEVMSCMNRVTRRETTKSIKLIDEKDYVGIVTVAPRSKDDPELLTFFFGVTKDERGIETPDFEAMSDRDTALYELHGHGLDASKLEDATLDWVNSMVRGLPHFSGVRLVSVGPKIGIELPGIHTWRMPDNWVSLRDKLEKAAGITHN